MSITRSQLIACAEVDVETPDLVNVSVLAGAAVIRGRYATQSLQVEEAVALAGELLGAAAAVASVTREQLDATTTEVGRLLDTLFAAPTPEADAAPPVEASATPRCDGELCPECLGRLMGRANR